MKVLIEFEKKPLLFQHPEAIIACSHPSSFSNCFKAMESALESGYYLAGFLSYEAGYCFEESLQVNHEYDFPLICFGVYKKPSHKKPPAKKMTSRDSVRSLRLNISQQKYFSNIAAIRSHIARGEVYQITYCIKLLFDFNGNPFNLYRQLLKEQPVPYPAYIEAEHFRILSLSPEMFLKKRGARISTKPMKGTWPRGEGLVTDILARMRFKCDKKNRAENVMIADLLRNDLGRVGDNIRAPKLFEIAGYKTLYQMTSTVTAKIDKDIPVYRLLASVFPSGSVTGTPKIRAMEVIRELEKQERRIYTGAIGYITPERDLFFNIPIRTLLISRGAGEMGIGGGIVWDSTPQGEWDEGLLKARFLVEMARNFI